ncbi:hypothetical protein [Lysobacter terrae]
MSTVIALPQRRPIWFYVVAGGIALATLDLIFAFTFWGALRGVSPLRILQSIASGLQGKAAFEGGGASALLGLACHYFIALMMVLAYTLVSAHVRMLRRRPVVNGLLYGLLLYGLMSYVVVPLSNAPQPTNAYPPWVAASIIMHAVFGVICAWSAHLAYRGR